MKKTDFSKMIGFVRYLDGSYRPSNDLSLFKFNVLMGENFVPPFPKITKTNLDSFRVYAKNHGYEIVTSIKGVRP